MPHLYICHQIMLLQNYINYHIGPSMSRYLLDYQILHPTEKYYPLRPELAESTFYLYQATKGLIVPSSFSIILLWFYLKRTGSISYS